MDLHKSACLIFPLWNFETNKAQVVYLESLLYSLLYWIYTPEFLLLEKMDKHESSSSAGQTIGEKRKSIVSATSSDGTTQRRKGSLISEDSFHIENSIPGITGFLEIF